MMMMMMMKNEAEQEGLVFPYYKLLITTTSQIQFRNLVFYSLLFIFGLGIGLTLSSSLKDVAFATYFQHNQPAVLSSLPPPPAVLSSPPPPPPPPPVQLDGFLEPPRTLMHGMSDGELLWRASMAPRVTEYPFKRVPKVAFMFLTRGPVLLAPLWDKFFEGHHPFYSVYVHTHPSFNQTTTPQPGSVFHNRQIPSQEVGWGEMNMVEAERRLLANALLDIGNERFVLLSESCIPLFNFQTIYDYLINSNTSFVESYDLPGPVGRGRYNRRMHPTVRLDQWRKGSQWFEMDRALAVDVVSDRTYFPIFQRYCKGSCYGDEHYLPTFVNIIKFQAETRRNSRRTLTYVDWSKGGPHPRRFQRTDVTWELLQRLRKTAECEYNGRNTTTVCFLFARKFMPNALDRLLRFAPKIMNF